MGGWIYEPWRGAFYPKGMPQKEELAYASRHLTSIEINGTFYRNPGPETFQKWHDETPDDFMFSLKAPRYVMNRRLLAGAGEAIHNFVEGGVKTLGAKLGAINWQFDARKPFDPEDFEACLALLPNNLRHAVEVRHESFRCAQFVDLARKYQVAIVLAGDSSHPLIPDVTAPFAYLRIMGTSEGNAAGYAEEQITAWANRAKTLAAGEAPGDLERVSPEPAAPAQRDVFLYVINGFKQSNPAAAMALIERMKSRA